MQDQSRKRDTNKKAAKVSQLFYAFLYKKTIIPKGLLYHQQIIHYQVNR